MRASVRVYRRRRGPISDLLRRIRASDTAHIVILPKVLLSSCAKSERERAVTYVPSRSLLSDLVILNCIRKKPLTASLRLPLLSNYVAVLLVLLSPCGAETASFAAKQPRLHPSRMPTVPNASHTTIDPQRMI